MEYSAQAVVLGRVYVGKTQLVRRMATKPQPFQTRYRPSIGFDFYRALELMVPEGATPTGNSGVTLWDSQGGFTPSTRPAIIAVTRRAFAYVLVFAVDDAESLADIESEYLQFVPDVSDDAERRMVLLVAAKCDQANRKVSTEEGMACADRIGADGYVETSAKTDAGINQLLRFLETGWCAPVGRVGAVKLPRPLPRQ